MLRIHTDPTRQTRNLAKRRGFTLIELLVVIGIVGILASIVLIAVNPKKQLTAAWDAQRKMYVREQESAITQYEISNGGVDPTTGIPLGATNALPICRLGVTGSCIALDTLVPTQVAALPIDNNQIDTTVTGYRIYKDTGQRVHICSDWISVGDADRCTTAGGGSSTSAGGSSSSAQSGGSFANGQNAASVLGQLNFGASNSAATQSGLNGPFGIYAAANKVFVADTANNRVLIYDISGGITNGMNATYVLGQPNFTTTTATTTQSGMQNPYGVHYDTASQRLFVGDTNNGRVLVYNLGSGITNGMNASNVIGQPDFTTRNPTVTQNGMGFGPFGMTYDATRSRLFVSDTANHRVLVYDLTMGVSNGMNASYVIGQTNFTTANGVVSQSGMIGPAQLSVDTTANRLFVGDLSANRVTAYDLSSGISNGMNATNVLGQPDFVSSAVPTTANALFFASGVSYDAASQQLYVGDAQNARVMIFNLSSGITNGMAASRVLGQSTFTSVTPSVSQNGLTFPTGVSYDPARGQLFVVERSTNRIVIF